LALYGLGGVGKTQLALMYAQQHFERHRASVFWINATSIETVVADIARFCDSRGLEANTTSEKVEAFKTFLSVDSSLDQWLLVLDNSDDLNSINLPQYFPTGSDGNVLSRAVTEA
jgi:GTPase SAR1 family protein